MAQLCQETDPCTAETPVSPLPVVDLNSHKAASDIRAASEGEGFFYLIGHGIDAELIEQVFEQSRLFFSLPLEKKLALVLPKDGNTRGYSPMGSEILDRRVQSRPCCVESFRVGTPTDRDERGGYPEASGGALGGCVWPADQDLPQFKPVVTRYHEAMEVVARRLAGLLLKSVGLPEDYLSSELCCPSAMTRLMRYDGQQLSRPEDGVYGTGPHTDWGVLTLLAVRQDEGVGGLEVLSPAQGDEPGQWKPVPPQPSTHTALHDDPHGGSGGTALVVNIGDALSRWTNGTLRSTPHRVVLQRAGRFDRYSVAYFYSANPQAIMACLPPFATPHRPPPPPPIRVCDYLRDKFAEIQAGGQAGQSGGDEEG